MDWPFIVGVTAALAGTLSVVGAWQRKLERRRRKLVLAELESARERGAHRAINQFPLIQATLCIGCGSCVEACPEGGVLGLIDGRARVINGARCVGHAKCEQACPVGAIKVGLGDVSLRPDIPVLSESLETSVPGVYIAGELGGIALIRHAIDQGRRAVDAIAQRAAAEAAPAPPGAVDLVIVGAGPAGLAASLRAIEKKLSYVTLSQDDAGGTIRKYPRRKLTLVQDADIPLHGRLPAGHYEKEALLALWRRLIETYKVDVRVGETLQDLSRRAGLLEARTASGVVRARFALLALGRRGSPRKLGVPGEESEKVLYQLQDAATYGGVHLLVVGGGDSAVEAATALANQPGSVVTLSYRKEAFFRLKSRNELRIKEYAAQGRVRVLFSSEVERFEPDAVTLRLGGRSERIRNDFSFVLAGGELPYPLLKRIGVRFGGEEAAS